jgi:uncharacterized protein YjiS (DUF1127 family)
MLCRLRSRRDIASLDRRCIEDLGTTPSQMRFEAQKGVLARLILC